MLTIIDQIGNRIELDSVPKRIVSLVPSITEYLYDLGLEDEVVGITKFCVHPEHWLKEKKIVGGTKQQHLEKIKELNPDLIIASKEENVKSYIEKLRETCPVYVSDVKDFNSAIEMMTALGRLTGKQDLSEKIIRSITSKFELLQKQDEKAKVAYCIWKDPWMWAGADTFISDMLAHAGYENMISSDRYPEIEMSAIIEENPAYIFLSSEPFPFQDKHIEELKAEFPQTNFIIVDGEIFSWYGSRMLKAPDYFNSLFKQFKTE